jgi:hypothetical protein
MGIQAGLSHAVSGQIRGGHRGSVRGAAESGLTGRGFEIRRSATIVAVAASAHLNFDDWLSISGVVIAIVGLAVAFVQLHRVRKTADAATRAVDRTQRQIAGAMMLSRTADLEAVEGRLRVAANESDQSLAEDAVRDWRRIAAEHQSLLKRANLTDADLDKHLELSLGIVDLALQELAAPEVAPEDACRSILVHASGACRHSRRVAAAMMLSSNA